MMSVTLGDKLRLGERGPKNTELAENTGKEMRKFTSPGKVVLLSLILIFSTSNVALAGLTFVAGQGVVLTGADGVVLTGADGVVLTGADGVVLTGADGVVLTGADGVVLTGADVLTYTGVEGVVLTGADAAGIRSFDSELALVFNQLPDSSAINVFIVFHRMPTDADFDALRSRGILGGTRFNNLPIVLVNATKSQVETVSSLPSVRSIYSNKTVEFLTSDTRVIVGQRSAVQDRKLTTIAGGVPISGRGIGVGVIDTGIDGGHPDVAYGTRVVRNARVVDPQGSGPGFLYPQFVDGLQNTDLSMGHGTFVSGVIAGTGAGSDGYYGGIAPGAHLVGAAVGDANLFFVLAGIDYILSSRIEQNIRVVNCSFGISGVFDANDPVNVATKIMHDSGISVVFSAGNRGDQPNALNPYSVAPWVIGVGSGTKDRTLSTFSSRGAPAYGIYHPTLIAPGQYVVAPRASGVNVIGTAGLAGALSSNESDIASIPPNYLTRYTMSSGTSFAAPHVAGTIALMLQANASLTPAEVKKILQKTASPMLGYSRYEVGAGYLNTHAAVRKAACGGWAGEFRGGLNGSFGSVSREPLVSFGGEVAPGETATVSFEAPDSALFSTVQVGWVQPEGLVNDLEVAVEGSGRRFESKPAAQLAGPGFRKTGITINGPDPGTWTVTIKNKTSPTIGGIQRYAGAIETFRIDYGDLPGIGHLSAAEQKSIRTALFTGLVVAGPDGFDAGSPATRLDLARAVALGAGARVPQFTPDSPTFPDVPDSADSVFIESVTNSPNGNLLEVGGGSYFSPGGFADRLTAAVATVKALGLGGLAGSAGLNPGLADWDTIPQQYRGYVALALSHNLISTSGTGYFRPYDPLTRAELASTAVALSLASK